MAGRTKHAVILAVVALGGILSHPFARAEPTLRVVGAAEIDITPSFPIRLRGYSGRDSESGEVSQRLRAKAMAIGSPDDRLQGLLVTFDNCVVPDALVRELAARLEKTHGLPRERLTVAATHTHNAPILSGMSETLYVHPLPKDQACRIDTYTSELIDKLEKVASDALSNRRPANLSWAKTKATFAHNRRTKNGPVDHDLPVMVARNPEGEVIAVWTSYACHCTTLSHNRISGDWAGYAMENIQEGFPSAIALVSAGCGGDQNSKRAGSNQPEEQDAMASRHGREIAAAVSELVEGGVEGKEGGGTPKAPRLREITGDLKTRLRWIDLPLAKHPTRREWEERAKTSEQAGTAGYHARVQLARLDRGEKLATSVPYPVQTWNFGNALAIVFLGGEAVVDYSLRLKREFDDKRIWINAYSNDVACYIPSERILKEGGYEGGGAMTFHDWPASFAPGLERRIIEEVRRQVPVGFIQNPAR
jgi:hypothetical protein